MFNYCLAFIEENLNCGTVNVPFEQVKFSISRLGISNYGYTFSKLLNQPYITNPIYSIYTQDFESDEFNYITDYIPENSIFPISLDITSEKISMDVLEVQTLIEYIKICDKNIFLPIIYSSDLKDAGHIGFMLVDSEQNCAYLVDPNGKPTYFNNVVNYNVSDKIEEMLYKYFKCVGVEYIHSNIWNSNNIVINKNFRNNYISSGHCSILTIMLSHMICKTDMSPKEIYQILGSLNNYELMFVIKIYSEYVYMLLNENNKLKSHNKIYNLYNMVKSNFDINLDEYMKIYSSIAHNNPSNIDNNIMEIFGLITVN